jgi:hypothetical protein
MTAIRDALTKAGIDTAGAELRTRAREALKLNRGNVGVAADKLTALLMKTKRRDLVGALVLQYVQRIAAEPEVVAENAVDARPKDVTVKQHDRHRKRTTAEREAALRVAGITAEAINDALGYRVNGRRVGDLAWAELGTMVHDNAKDAASFLRLGTEATANALLLFKIKNHAQVEDQTMTIRQVISADAMQSMIDAAYAEAPRVVKLGMENYERRVVAGNKEMETAA